MIRFVCPNCRAYVEDDGSHPDVPIICDVCYDNGWSARWGFDHF